MLKRIAVFGLALLLLAACGSTPAAPAPSSGSTPAPTAPAAKVKIQFWHSMSGVNGDALQGLVDEFNKSQDKVEVQAVFQGAYDDALAKLKAAGNDGPAMIQVYEIGSRFMIDSGLVTPVQKFIDADKYDMSDFEPNIASYYKFDGKYYSLPFNTSTPIMYYNKNAFKAAGLDPEKPPKTWEEFASVAKQLTKTDASGQTTQFGTSIAWYGWFFEQWLATQNATYVDNGNGRTGKAAKAVVNSKEGVAILNWLKSMIDAKTAANTGRKTADAVGAFVGGKTAMTFESTAALGTILKNTDGKFDVGTGYLPRPAGATGGVIIGGASLWIINTRPDAEQKAAWEFGKWITSAHAQGIWYTKTGYFPVRKSAYEEQTVKDTLAKRPQFTTAIEQLHASPNTEATRGAVIGTFPAARQTIEDTMENTILGHSTADAGLKAAAETITKAIETYNKTNK